MQALLGARRNRDASELSRIIGQHRWFDEEHSAGYNNAGIARILAVAHCIFGFRNFASETNGWRGMT